MIVGEIAPGPGSSGMASGTTAMLSLSSASFASSGVCCSPLGAARIIDMASNSMRIAPPTLNEAMVMPKNPRRCSPTTAETVRTTATETLATRAMRFLSATLCLWVRPRNIGMVPIGLTITSSATKIFTYSAKSSMEEGCSSMRTLLYACVTPQHAIASAGEQIAPEEKLMLRSNTLASVLALVAAQAAFAQDPSTSSGQAFPSRPVRLVVPFAAGGVTDTSARAVSDRLGARLGQPVVVENRPGASGNIGTEQVARSAPDGHTLVLGFDGTMVINPHVFAKIPFDTLRDFAPVTKLGDAPLILVAHPSVPANSLQELIEQAKARPFAFGTSGTGGTPHLAGEMLAQRTGAQLMHVPYKGGGQAVIDVLGGQIPLVFTAVASSQQFVKSGKLKAIGVSSARRSSSLPDVPTFAESGLPGFVVDSWVGVLAPARTPQPVIERLQREIAAVLADPVVRERYGVLGIEPVGNTPEQFAAQIREDLARWEKVVRQAGIKLE